MNYDDWKLATPDYEQMVSECCGADYDYINDDYEPTCCKCNEETFIIEKYEYDISEKEAIAEMRMDEERLERD